jgi:hypothetical protein
MEAVVWHRWRLVAGDKYRMTAVESLGWQAAGCKIYWKPATHPSFLPFPSFPFLSFPPPTRTCDIDAFSMEIF